MGLGSWSRVGAEQTKRWKIGMNCLFFVLYKYNNFLSMRSSPYSLFIILDHPLISNLKVREIYCYIYQKTYILINSGGWCFSCHFISHVCGQESWFQNWSKEDFSLNNHGTPTLSISHNIFHEVRNILFQINGHKRTSLSEGTGLGS